MHQQNDKMEELRQSSGAGAPGSSDMAAQARCQDGELAADLDALKKEFAWCVVQTDRVNFQLRNALWGVALGKVGGGGGAASQQDGGGITQSNLNGSSEASHHGEQGTDTAAVISQVRSKITRPSFCLCRENMMMMFGSLVHHHAMRNIAAVTDISAFVLFFSHANIFAGKLCAHFSFPCSISPPKGWKLRSLSFHMIKRAASLRLCNHSRCFHLAWTRQQVY
jgi:hypothetical protein